MPGASNTVMTSVAWLEANTLFIKVYGHLSDMKCITQEDNKHDDCTINDQL